MSAPRLQDDIHTKPGTKEVTTRITTHIPKEPDIIKNEKTVTKVRWRNRRRMAWTSLIAMLILTLVLLFAPIPEAKLRIIVEPLTWFFFSMTSIIGAYMGFTTWASKK